MSETPSLADLLHPSSIAIVGASQDPSKYGARMLRVLQLHGYDGLIYPINRKQRELSGLRAYPSIKDVPGTVDLAVLCVSRDAILEALDECAGKEVKVCIILATKFGETGGEGRRLEQQVLEKARHHGIRLIGPNCLGFVVRKRKIVLIPSSALFVHHPVPAGWVGIVSQSGAMASTLLDLAAGMGLGISAAFAIGNQIDLAIPDFIRYLADDSETKAICCYVEGLRDFPDFVAALKYASERRKPVIVMKAGRTPQGGKAAFTHTASLTSDYDAFRAYVEEAGAMLANEPKAMLLTAGLLGRGGADRFDSVIMVTNSGGGGAVVADRLADVGVVLRNLNGTTVKRLGSVYFETHAVNPVDWGGSDIANEDVLLNETFSALACEEGKPIVLIALMSNPDMKQTAEDLAAHIGRSQHTSLCLVVPDKIADVSREILRQRGMLIADGIDEVVNALAAVIADRRPGISSPSRPPKTVSDASHLQVPTRLLAAFDIPYVKSIEAATCPDAIRAAGEIGYPVAIKLVSASISHKSDVGGVELDIRDDDGVRNAWQTIRQNLARTAPSATMQGVLVQAMVPKGLEFLVGVSEAEGIGPVVVVGAGGTLTELLHDRAVLPVPCSPEWAAFALRKLKSYRLIQGYRGTSAYDEKALIDIIVSVSRLAFSLKDSLAELDLNPVVLSHAGAQVVDFRFLVKEKRNASHWN